jgi:cytochrome d ubiquinol oxidase subunit II
MGPFWDGNEVWLITAGGVTFAAFPKVYATMFSTLYTPLMLILISLIIRGISFEFRSKDDSLLWQRIFDGFMVLGSFLAALLLGVAFANIFRGIPFDSKGIFHGNIFTLLNPYGLAGGVLFLLMFAVHGCTWLTAKTDGKLNERARKLGGKLWNALLIVAVLFLIATWYATPLWNNYLKYPALAIFPLLAVTGLVLTKVMMVRGKEWNSWFASGLTILSVVGFGVAGLYPNLFPSLIDPKFHLTAGNASSTPLTLKIMFGVAIITVPIVIVYQAVVYRIFSHKLTDNVLDREAY